MDMDKISLTSTELELCTYTDQSVSRDLSALNPPEAIKQKLPVIYSPNYDITLKKTSQEIPLDFQKRQKVCRQLCNHLSIEVTSFHEPEPVTDSILKQIHTPEYLDSLGDPETVSTIFSIPELSDIAAPELETHMIRPMRYATGGTLLGVKLALEHKWAINLSGGFHHASGGRGEGFCFFSDIALAAKAAQLIRPEARIAVVDLDAHQGNGTARALKNDEQVVIFDLFNQEIFPRDKKALGYTDHPVAVNSAISESDYLGKVREIMTSCLSDEHPDLIIYNAGSDILKGDPLGKMNISGHGVILRDQIVFRRSREAGVPILVLLSGGYAPEVSTCISSSLAKMIRFAAEN